MPGKQKTPARSRIEHAIETFCALIGLRGRQRTDAQLKASIKSATQKGAGFEITRAALATTAQFLGGRSKADVETTDLRELERIGVEHHTIEDIIDDKDPGSLFARVVELTALERVSQNLEISSRIDPLKLEGDAEENLANVRKQDWPIQVKLKKFIAIKQRICIKEGIELTLDNLNVPFFGDKELRREDLLIATRILLREAFAEACDGDAAQFKAFVKEAAGEMLPEETAAMLNNVGPDGRLIAAPERYKERKNRKEKPVEFIVRVYGPHKGRVDRGDLKRLDEPLYRSLYRWLVDNDETAELQEIVPKTRTRRPIDADLSAEEKLEEIKRRHRESANRAAEREKERRAAERKRKGPSGPSTP